MPETYESGTVAILKILTPTSPIEIPPYQRSYSWEKTQVEDLWNDLESNWEDDASSTLGDVSQNYFLGTIVSVPGGFASPSALLDGQQRLATITIILCALRNHLKRLGAKEEAVQLDHKSIGSQEHGYALTLNQEDRDFFKRAIQNAEPEVPQTLKSHRRIHSALSVSNRRIERLTANQTTHESIERIFTLAKTIVDKVLLVSVKVMDEDTAYTVFEVLNTRGLELGVADLLRNFLISRATDKDSVASRWDSLARSVDGSDLSAFLRYSWLARHGELRKKSAFSTIRSGLSTSGTPSVERRSELEPTSLPQGQVQETPSTDYLSELEQDAQAYLSLLNPSATTPTALRDLLFGLKALRARQPLPLLMTVSELLPRAIESAISIVLATAVRFTVTGRNPNSLEKRYSETARKLRDPKLDATATMIALAKELGEISPADDEFKKAFTDYESDNQPLQRYILWEIEKYLRSSETLGELTLADSSAVHVEHIYPQTPRKECADADMGNATSRLGNLTLLSGIPNQQLQNQSFEKKRGIYELSDLVITRRLASLSAWDPDAVAARQADFANLAVSIWPRA